MTAGASHGLGVRMLRLEELCDWLNITERHARKLVERDAIPYRKVGRLLRFVEADIEEWSRPKPRPAARPSGPETVKVSAARPRPRGRLVLPKSLIEGPLEEAGRHVERRSA